VRKLGWAVSALALLVLAAAGTGWYYARRALPVVDGMVEAPGLAGRVEVVRDRWGVPHIFAEHDVDAYYALGWVTAQDRLFQMELLRHAAQGRLAEMFGSDVLEVDRLFRTMDFHGIGRRMLARTRPEVRQALQAFTRGVNACVASRGGRLPPEFLLLRRSFAPAQEDDFVGVLGYMTWGLNISWTFDPLYEKLVARLGPDRAAELFPYNRGGSPSVYPSPAAAAPALEPTARLDSFSPAAERLLASLPRLAASNNWVVGPSRSASGQPVLANDPHLGLGLPGVWYQVHLKSPTQDVIGVTVPGLPLVVIGHNRDVAWGFTNLMLDAADFFVEKLKPDDPGLVMHRGEWVPVETREEILLVRDREPERLLVRSTPHGPIVTGFFPDQFQTLSYRWTFRAADHANEIEGIYDLNRAHDWTSFRRALSRFGAVAQNVAYADRAGHIGMQAAGAIPRLQGSLEGTRFRVGWDGSEDWDGFVPFEENPSVLDPPEGFLASANNPTVPAPAPYYISSQWEPVDRYLRIREVLTAKEKVSVADMRRLQQDTTFVSARELTPRVLAAFASAPPAAPVVHEALARLEDWDGDMRADSPAAALFAAFYKHLFYEIFADELGPELARGYRSKANLSAIMMRAVLSGDRDGWLDRQDTPAAETLEDVLRAAFGKAVYELQAAIGGSPADWAWGRLHTLELQHPLGRGSRLLGLYFNRGPFPVPGHNGTVNKAEFPEEHWRVQHGPSMRQITDFGDLDAALAVLPGGQSGIPASPHYDDLADLWLSGDYHPFPMGRAAVDAVAASRLVLAP
jgi:penicillin amidase